MWAGQVPRYVPEMPDISASGGAARRPPPLSLTKQCAPREPSALPTPLTRPTNAFLRRGLATVRDVQKQQPSGGTPSEIEAQHGPRHGDDSAAPRVQGIENSIRPGASVPHTVLIADMGRGAVFLMGWEIGPIAYLTAEDALGLKRELARAFGSQNDPA